jgi:phage tail sheath protein FI
MPEYLAPGVFVEEMSSRQKPIEGVSTTTTAFVGPTRYGPEEGEPPLLASFTEFERIYGGLDQLEYDDEAPSHNYVAHAVRAYFEEGGRRLYVARTTGNGACRSGSETLENLVITARHVGAAGNLSVTLTFKRSENILEEEITDPSDPLNSQTLAVIRGASHGDIVMAAAGVGSPKEPGIYALYEVESNIYGGESRSRLLTIGASPQTIVDLEDVDFVHLLTVNVVTGPLGQLGEEQSWEGLNFRPDDPDSVFTVFQRSPTTRRTTFYAPVMIHVSDTGDRGAAVQGLVNRDSVAQPPAIEQPSVSVSPALSVMSGLIDPKSSDTQRTLRLVLERGSDGERPQPSDYEGDGDDPKTSLRSLEDLEEISIIAAPGPSHNADADIPGDVRRLLISHCDRMRYRVAVLDSTNEQLISDVRHDKAEIDTTCAGFYYPWVEVADPITENDIYLPPSGFVCGIYARNDIERGVHKAPANEVVRLAKGVEFRINKSQQEVLTLDGVNVLRFFEGRGVRVWGARTCSSNPEWKYINVRRYFAFLERSIERGTQWAVFEPNRSTLWVNVRSMISDFLFNEWKVGRIAGAMPDEAFFVRCDRTTMTQNDLDNGRMICLIGVAPVCPAEFVIFRIGQRTMDSAQ